ncbi:transcriptional regulator [Croceicoccus estronivorus]|uniref:S24 family peptidase n=1 Tax=Croceicoccus estronivorus TaxID=1172626 RepID=UPI000830651F|nr:S24 family peptidase [Croceicoccus estronivorus]OCC22830.1 transcriptional regulator [Croceicoccus estronivorus]
MSDVRKRLLELAEEARVSLAALSQMIGRNPSYLQQYIRKGSPRKLDETDRATLAGFFGVAESELGGVEEISLDSRIGKRMAGWVEVPRLALDASAGPGAFGTDELPFDSFRFSARWLRERDFDAAMLSIITVAGDSMEPLLRDGDEILVDRTPRPLRDGVHVVRLGEALHVKRVQQLRPDAIKLISANEAYPPVEVALADVDVIGRVVWKAGRL